MQNWEYLVVSVTDERHANGVSLQTVLFVNGDKHLVDRRPHKYEITNKYGQEGWELVAVNFKESGYWEMIFKRPEVV